MAFVVFALAWALAVAVVLFLVWAGRWLLGLLGLAAIAVFFALVAWWLHSIWAASPLLFCTLLILYAISSLEERNR
jgi:hypothetical protein